MQIEYWPLTRPKPYARNARKWTASAVEKVASSIREFGWRQPIVCDAADVIIIGHLRLAAAKLLESRGQLAPAGQVPVHVAADLDAARVKALRLADNRTHQEAEWDEALLGPELIDLRAMDIDLRLTTFDRSEIAPLILDGWEDSGHSTKKNAGAHGLEFRVVVDCESEEHQTELLQRFEEEGLKCRPLIS